MKEEQDDLTLVYMFGFKNGKESMKAENERLRAALRGVLNADGVTDEIAKLARAALEGEKSDD